MRIKRIFVGKVNKTQSAIKKSSVPKFLLISFIVILVILVVAGGLMYYFWPTARVRIYIESKPIAAEKTYTGKPGTVFDNNLATMAVKVEEVTKQRSDSTKATGVDFRGTKSSGIVVVKCNNGPGVISVPSGTTITSSTGKNYVTVSEVKDLSCPATSVSVTVQASEVGPEYDMAGGAGSPFTITGFEVSKVWGDNSASFVGGTKVQYKVVSQTDIDGVVNKLKDATFTEATSDLKQMKAVDGWVIVEQTIKNQLDGDTKTDVPVDAEADIVNVTIKTKSTATYYKRSDIEGIKETILTEQAQKTNLFQGISGVGLQPIKNINTTITVESADLETNTITVKAKYDGLVKPEVDEQEIIKNLSGKNWDDGLAYLKTLNFVAKPIEETFNPVEFPRFLWHFPSSQGRIFIDVEDVKTEVTPTPTPTSTETPTPSE